MQAAWRAQLAVGRNGETLPAVARHHHAKARQQLEGNLHIGPRNQFAYHLDHDVALRHQRQRHQQGGQELAGDVAAHFDRRVQLKYGLADAQWRVAWLAQVLDMTAELTQRIHQVAYRSLVHARHTPQLKVATQHGQRGGQRPDRGASVAHEELGSPHGQLPAQAIYLDRGATLAYTATQ